MSLVYEVPFPCWSKEQISCAEMCESLIAYGCDKSDRYGKIYLAPHRKVLGEREADSIYDAVRNYLDSNYVLVKDMAEDGNGNVYAGLVHKNSIYPPTGECLVFPPEERRLQL